MMRKFILIILLIIGGDLFSQSIEEQSIDKSFLIVLSTKNYDAALKRAKEASQKLNLELKLRGLYADALTGLNSDEVCGCGESHGYVPRGRYDDGKYVSVEYSNVYSKFDKGYYIVVVASGIRGSKDLNEEMKKTKAIYKTAYLKATSVYVGCMH